MTRDEALDLDIRVAELALGATWRTLHADQVARTGEHAWLEVPGGVAPLAARRTDGTVRRYGRLPHFSTDLGATAFLLALVRQVLPPLRQVLRLTAYPYNRTYATFDAHAEPEHWTEANGEHATPEAIARAFVAACEAVAADVKGTTYPEIPAGGGRVTDPPPAYQATPEGPRA